MKRKKHSIGFGFAYNGLKEIMRNERNFKIHLCATLLVLLTGIILKLSLIEWSILIIVVGFVLVAELINSAIERIIDYLKPEIHPAAKVIKDVGAGAVLMAVITSVIIGALIFLPKLMSLI